MAHGPRFLWPGTMSVVSDGHLYDPANQLHRQAKHQGGKGKRRKPHTLSRIRLGARPALQR